MKTTMLVAAMIAASLAFPQAKPIQAKPAQTKPVLGTTQLPGDNGKLDQAYTMGNEAKLNIVLTGVRYTKTRWTHGNDNLTADRDHKLMILSFQIQNPNKEITMFTGSSLKFTAIDQEGENHEGVASAIQKSNAKELSIDLKPAQRIDCETAILVPAKGVVPKLMVAHARGGAVLRYDLHDVIKPLEKPYSENGSDAAPIFAGEKDTYYSLLDSDVKYASTAFKERQLGSNTCDPEKQIYMLSRMTFRMQTPVKGFMRFEGEAVDENGDKYPSVSIRKAGTEDHMASYAESGEETNGRMAFVIPKGLKIAKMRIWETTRGKSSAIEFPVDMYATADGQPLTKDKPAEAAPVAPATIQAYSYTATFRKADGSTAMIAETLERNEGNTKMTEITAGGKKALLIEDGKNTTLFFPATGEAIQAPVAIDKEPTTSLSYYELAYANATAPKKKKSPFGNLGKALLDGGANDLGQSILSSDDLGKVVVSRVAEHTLTQQLGRAVMTSTESNGSVAVDKKVYVETTSTGIKNVPPTTFKMPPTPQTTDAKTLYKRFVEFMSNK